MNGITLDTGALIALERRRPRMSKIYSTAVATGVPVTAPVAAIAEWWRGRSDARERILRGLRLEAMDTALAREAGEAIATIASATAIDAIVMASAARRGDVVYTSEVDDLVRLTAYFPAVRVLGV